MKKFWILICCIISILLLIILIDIIRVAWCSEPYITISTNCEYTEEWAVYTNKWIWYKYIENSLDTILWIETYIFWIKSCDIPSLKEAHCIKEQKEPSIEDLIVPNQKSTWEEIAYTDKYDITLTKKWRTDWDKEDWPFYSWNSTFLTKELDNWYEYYYDIPRWSWKNKHIIIAFDSDEYIWESDLDLSNTEYILNIFEERNPYYPYFLIPKIWFTWTVDYMQLWEDFEIECRDIDHLLDLDKRNCNLWKEMDRSESPFSLKDWTSIERLDDSDWCDKFKWYENRYIIKNTDIWCWVWVNSWTKVKSIHYK